MQGTTGQQAVQPLVGLRRQGLGHVGGDPARIGGACPDLPQVRILQPTGSMDRPGPIRPSQGEPGS
jgi:hypothetical protein